MSTYFIGVIGALSASLWKQLPFGTNSIQSRLAPELSHAADIFLPGSEGFVDASTRWNAADQPSFDAIVKVATEQDVEKTIQYANAHKKPFLTISGGHGTSSTLKDVQHGIGILMRGMNTISIVDSGAAVLIDGGVQNGELVHTLWDAGKQTVTTGCDCVGYIAPILGGGHGWLQGRYGLPADQLISARLVLANATTVTVSQEENEDLFWALRGAGHNFGVVTQAKIRIYDREQEQDEWAASGFVFEQEKMESVFGIANGWLGSPDRPKEMIHYGVLAFDSGKLVVILWIYYQGPSVPTIFTDPLYALEPLAVDTSVTNLPGVNTHLFADKDGISCAKGYSRTFYSISLNTWSLPNLRAVLEILSNVPLELRNSVVMLEAYATNRVLEIPAEQSAFADRESQLLVGILLTYEPNGTVDALARDVGTRMRSALLQGTGLRMNAYVNYARGDESVEAVYGYEAWRLEKLRRLKKEYDPFGRFNFFAPIV